MEAPNVVLEQQKRLKALLDKDNSGTVSPAELAEALGEGFSANAIRNAAFEGLLPFGFGHREHLKGQRYVAIPKITVWNWFCHGG
ncbi:hypothetical protein [Acetobacterium sp.]|uniref:hypothetical protein n=1 Tax=Acetobacterium sp. TaxID=1872094 RepID=UPI002F412C9E